jgi:uncharacterized OsmC-like protein/alpha/beta superfamily hydrolase
MTAASVLRASFKGSSGDELAARLDLPAGPVRAFALFAHCFTCGKDVLAAKRIAAGLAAAGVGVLRFDFTGLGSSEGEFANTNFSSNVEDLVRAAGYLRERYAAPAILIGHSLGGAAVLAAAASIPEAKAVVTIGAPADVAHILQHFGSSRIHSLGKALLVMHAPLDNVVGIDNATKIFVAAQHPKSFISLDDADHLVSSGTAAAYAADVIVAWASKYIPAASADSAFADHVLVRETRESKFQNMVMAGRHRLLADEPVAVGGLDSGPNPYDFLSVALGACTAMTLRIYAEHKKLALGRISVEVRHGKVAAEHCADCGHAAEGREGRIDRFERIISIDGDVDQALGDKIVEIAGKCPVHRTLEASSAVVTRLTPATGPV